jgi:hypothetical protein
MMGMLVRSTEAFNFLNGVTDALIIISVGTKFKMVVFASDYYYNYNGY